MARSISKAPKERINVTYKTVVNGAEEEVELPLKILMLGDYTGKPDDTPIEDRKTIKVDKDNFKDVMKSQNLQLELSVPDRISKDTEDNIGLKLNIQSLADFTPDRIGPQVPEINELLKLRDSLRKQVRPRMINDRAFRKTLQSMLSDASRKAKLADHLGVEGDAE